jgi:hypothetical protein
MNRSSAVLGIAQRATVGRQEPSGCVAGADVSDSIPE